MNCNLELVEKQLKKDYPYVINVRGLVESDPTSEMPIPHFEMDIVIKESFFNQLQNNGPLRNITVTSFTNECSQLLRNICPENNITADNLVVSFLSNPEL